MTNYYDYNYYYTRNILNIFLIMIIIIGDDIQYFVILNVNMLCDYCTYFLFRSLQQKSYIIRFLNFRLNNILYLLTDVYHNSL